MALSDCDHCWETPCVCGYNYKDWANERVAEMINALLKYRPGTDRKAILKMVNDGYHEIADK